MNIFQVWEAAAQAVQLTAAERVFQIIGLVILFGGLALFPVYYVLNLRRKRIRRSFEQKPDETDPEEQDGE